MPTWRPAAPGTPLPAPAMARPPPRRPRRSRLRHRRASKLCAPSSRPAATKALIGCASSCPSRCSGRSSRRAASANSCCAALRKCAPSGRSSAPSTTFSSSPKGGLCPRRCRSRPKRPKGRDNVAPALPTHFPSRATPRHRDNLDRLLGGGKGDVMARKAFSPLSESAKFTRKAPNPTDKHVGNRVRMRRMMLSMSQEKLGDALGLTFQQVQKYEKGTNRIGASRLQHIAQILQVPVSFFFEGGPAAQGTRGVSEGASPSYVSDFLATRDGLALAKAFMAIEDKKLRRCIVTLVEEIVGDS